MTTTWTLTLVLAFVFMLGSGLVWLVSRMNAQIRRYADGPTPKAAFETLKDLQMADTLTISGLQIKVTRLETEMEDLHALFRKHQSRDAAQSRRNNEVDVAKFDEYVAGLAETKEDPEEPTQTEPESLEDWR